MGSQPNSAEQTFAKQKKRSTDSDVYLSADEQVDVHSLIDAQQSSYVFPRDDQLNYICVFQGCTKPILRGLSTDEYLMHLRDHVTLSDRLLSNMLRRVDGDETDIKKRRRANSTNTYVLPAKAKGLDTKLIKEEMCPIGSPSSPTDSPPSTPRKRANSTDEYEIPSKPSSRGIQLRDQMLRYGLHLFRIDSEGKYICFFDECALHMMTNFSRHIAKHEKNGDRIKQELLHLCSPTIIQEQLQQHPNLHPTIPPQFPSLLQKLLFTHQQETMQLRNQQQQQQQQQISLRSSPRQLDQMQAFHTAQLQQLQAQHKQQLQMLQQNIQSPPLSPLQPHVTPSSPIPPHVFPQQEHIVPKQPPKQNAPELNLLGQVQNEADLALMRTQISKMLEESSSRRPLNKPRSLSLAYTPSAPSPHTHSGYLSPSPSHQPQPGYLSPSLSPSTPHANLRISQRNTPLSESSSSPALIPSQPSSHLPSPHPSQPSSQFPSQFLSQTPSQTPSQPSFQSPSPSPTSSSEIQWIFSKTRPVLS